LKIVILAIDALEYNLVESLNLRHLKQFEYGKVVEPDVKLLTPILWASFITGGLDHGVKSFTVRRNPIVRLGGAFFDKIGTGANKHSRKFMRKVLMRLGIATSAIDKRDLKAKTFFVHAKKPMAISIPAYNEWQAIHKFRLKYPLVRLVEDSEERRISECIEENWKIFHKKLDYTQRMLKSGEYDLLMTHFLILDTIGHLFWHKPGKIRDAYRYVDNVVGDLLSKLENQMVLIISDHGMKKGEHTNYAFYSSNISLRLESPKLTDFYNKIINVLNYKSL
jgi:predicted AlkP superfamily pyrophosphatase or phosphodiesterase